MVGCEVSDEIDGYDRANAFAIAAINATLPVNGPNAIVRVPDYKSIIPKHKKAVYGTSA